MKKIAAFGIIILLFLSQTETNAQIIRLGLNGGLTSISSPSYYTNSDNGLGFGTNLHFGAQARIDLPLVPITPIVFVEYDILRGDGEINNVKLKDSQNILSIGVKGEYFILPLPLVKPYISLDVALNKIGALKMEAPRQTTTSAGYTRYGGSIGIGTVITVLPMIDLDLSLKYQTLNLVGKSDGESNISLINLDLAVIF